MAMARVAMLGLTSAIMAIQSDLAPFRSLDVFFRIHEFCESQA